VIAAKSARALSACSQREWIVFARMGTEYVF
jgi:hypothetical protein